VARGSKVYLKKEVATSNCGTLVYNITFDEMPVFPYTVRADFGFLIELTADDIMDIEPSIYTSNPPRAA
jgi:hypothetical protein